MASKAASLSAIEIERLYARAKAGAWAEVLADFAQRPQLCRVCARFVKPGSGWTFLHQAAYFGREDAVRVLIAAGASLACASRAGETAADVAAKQGFDTLAQRMRVAAKSSEQLWRPSRDADLLPSSSAWTEALPRHASTALSVAYGGSAVIIPAGAAYFVDSFERVLVGWHGSYDPPCGMDGQSLLRGGVPIR